MVEKLNCVDMSRWGGELTTQEAQDMWNMGITHIIVGTGNPFGAGLWAKQQALKWLEVNPSGTVDAYIYLYMAGSASQQVSWGISSLSDVPIRMWWLDAEDVESPELTPYQRVVFLFDCVDAIGDKEVGIYTGRWWWIPYMDNSTAFYDMPLWNSYYDEEPDEDGLPYGGWEHSTIEQYKGTTDIAGQSVDLNYAKNLKEENEMTNEELNQIVQDLNTVMVKRMVLMEIGAGPMDRLLQAYDTLKAAGLI